MTISRLEPGASRLAHSEPISDTRNEFFKTFKEVSNVAQRGEALILYFRGSFIAAVLQENGRPFKGGHGSLSGADIRNLTTASLSAQP
jgi:hypothetical protein